MPLNHRVIEPLYICRDILPQENPILKGRELECMANGSLANIIRQLSCLASYADDVFLGLLEESKRLAKKTEHIKNRISRLSANVENLDFQQEEVSFVDENCNQLFKSTYSYDQEVLSKSTMPNSLTKKYLMCDKPPPLDKLNPYRDDNKDAIKFYTDPNYFFDLWKNEMLKKTEKEKFSKKMISNQSLNTTKQIEESHTSKQSKKPRKPESTTEKYRRMMSQQGEFFVDSNQIPGNQTANLNSDYSPYGTIEIKTNRDLNRQQNQVDGENMFSITNHMAPQQPQIKPTIQQFRLNDQTSLSSQKENTNHVRFNQIPEYIPISPVMMAKNDQLNTMNNNFAQNNIVPLSNNNYIPPPPPLPTTALVNNNSINVNNNLTKSNLNSNGTVKMQSTNLQTTSLAQEIIKKQQEGLKAAPVNQSKPMSQMDARSELLNSIREGIKLRSVQQRKQKQVEKDSHLKDVASILARRVAMSLSDSDGESNDGSGDDWVDD